MAPETPRAPFLFARIAFLSSRGPSAIIEMFGNGLQASVRMADEDTKWIDTWGFDSDEKINARRERGNKRIQALVSSLDSLEREVWEALTNPKIFDRATGSYEELAHRFGLSAEQLNAMEKRIFLKLRARL